MKTRRLAAFNPAREFHYRDTTVDEASVSSIFDVGDFNASQWEQGKQLLKRYNELCMTNEVPLILDLGAHIGEAGVWFASQFPAAAIFSLEPDGENAKLARANTSGLNIAVIEAAISDHAGHTQLVDHGRGSWGYTIIPEDAAGQPRGAVSTLTIDDLLRVTEECNLKPFILKFNIEGAEAQLFSGDCKWIDLFELVVGEIHDWMLPGKNTGRVVLTALTKYDRDFLHNRYFLFSFKNHSK